MFIPATQAISMPSRYEENTRVPPPTEYVPQPPGGIPDRRVRIDDVPTPMDIDHDVSGPMGMPTPAEVAESKRIRASFDPCQIGRIEYFPDEIVEFYSWVAKFGYQPASASIFHMIDLYDKPLDVRTRLPHISTLELSDHYPDWKSKVFDQAVLGDFALRTRLDYKGLTLFKHMSIELQQMFLNSITWRKEDASIRGLTGVMKMADKVGFMEYVEYFLTKTVRRTVAGEADRIEATLFNATISPTGDNAKFVLDKLIHAITMSLELGLGFGEKFLVGLLVRAFLHCEVCAVNTRIKWRLMNRPYTFKDGTVVNIGRMSFTDTYDTQQSNGHRAVDWTTRLKWLMVHARELVAELEAEVLQLTHVSEKLFPVYIEGWTPYSATLKPTSGDYLVGPQPPATKGGSLVRRATRYTDREYSYASNKRTTLDTGYTKRRRSPSRDTRYTSTTPDKRGRYNTTHPYSGSRTSPPTIDESASWYMDGKPRCLTCGGGEKDGDGHVRMHECLIRQRHFPTWELDMDRVKARVNEIKANIRSSTQVGDRGRSRERSYGNATYDRSRSREAPHSEQRGNKRDEWRQERPPYRERSEERGGRIDRGRSLERERDASRGRSHERARSEDRGRSRERVDLTGRDSSRDPSRGRDRSREPLPPPPRQHSRERSNGGDRNYRQAAGPTPGNA